MKKIKLNQLIREELDKLSKCNFLNLKTTGMDYYDGIIKNNGNQYKHPSPKLGIEINKLNPIKYELKYMSKEEYGKLIKRTMSDPNYIQNEKIIKMMDNMKRGIKYDTPIVDLVDTYNFQEGRHRVIAASNLGCQLIPVYIYSISN
jgi:hypothetical protein